jgi:hypothetical protein
MSFSPGSFPLDKVTEKEGTISFKIGQGNMYESSGNIIIFDQTVGDTSFKLYRNEGLDLIFEQANSQRGTREARVNLKQFGSPGSLHIILVWSPNEISLNVGEPGKSNLKTSKGNWSKETNNLSVDEEIKKIRMEGITTFNPEIMKHSIDTLVPYGDRAVNAIMDIVNATIRDEVRIHGLDAVKKIKGGN